jgi:hypothetical protein
MWSLIAGLGGSGNAGGRPACFGHPTEGHPQPDARRRRDRAH